jgi:hypothetical protein
MKFPWLSSSFGYFYIASSKQVKNSFEEQLVLDCMFLIWLNYKILYLTWFYNIVSFINYKAIGSLYQRHSNSIISQVFAVFKYYFKCIDIKMITNIIKIVISKQLKRFQSTKIMLVTLYRYLGCWIQRKYQKIYLLIS